jgi:hypothetical protein
VLIPAASLCIPDQYWFKNLKARLVRSGQVRSGQIRSVVVLQKKRKEVIKAQKKEKEEAKFLIFSCSSYSSFWVHYRAVSVDV